MGRRVGRCLFEEHIKKGRRHGSAPATEPRSHGGGLLFAARQKKRGSREATQGCMRLQRLRSPASYCPPSSGTRSKRRRARPHGQTKGVPNRKRGRGADMKAQDAREMTPIPRSLRLSHTVSVFRPLRAHTCTRARVHALTRDTCACRCSACDASARQFHLSPLSPRQPAVALSPSHAGALARGAAPPLRAAAARAQLRSAAPLKCLETVCARARV